MKYLRGGQHEWESVTREFPDSCRYLFATRCVECGADYRFFVDKIEMREIRDPRMFRWRLENAQIFMELNLPCTYLEPNA